MITYQQIKWAMSVIMISDHKNEKQKIESLKGKHIVYWILLCASFISTIKRDCDANRSYSNSNANDFFSLSVATFRVDCL